MKIQESSVELSASHEFHYAAKMEIRANSNFRQVLSQFDETSREKADEARARVARVLQSLVDAILAAIEGKAGTESFADNRVLSPETTDSLPSEVPRTERVLTWEQETRYRIDETETSRVCGSGRVQTADGRTIDFRFGVDMARSFHQQTNTKESGTVVLRDPLVLNFAGMAASLSDKNFRFDLNADGTPELLPELAQGSGFLVFDANANGCADDGRELFGAMNGRAFADLARLDSDGNGWIDEGDPAFTQLAVWSADQFASLVSLGIGALSTQSVQSPFLLKSADNALLGQIRATGLYLSETGTVGSLQQLDLAEMAELIAPAKHPEEGQKLAGKHESKGEVVGKADG